MRPNLSSDSARTRMVTDTAIPVLAAVNGSDGSQAAVRYAASRAARIGCPLHIAHIAPSYLPGAGIVPGAPIIDISEFEAVGHDILSIAAKEAHSILPRGQVSTVLQLGNRVAGVLDLARGARLLVVGDERTPMLARMAVGGFIGTLAAKTPVPMVSVPAGWSGLRDPDADRRVVLGVKDPQRIPFDVLRAGFQAAADHDAILEITHVWSMPPGYGHLVTAMMEDGNWQTMIQHFVRRLAAPLRDEFPEVSYVTTTWYGQAAHILRERARGAELLVLARREHGFPMGHFGSTGKALLREVMCPVEVLPLAERSHGEAASEA